MTPKKIIVYEF